MSNIPVQRNTDFMKMDSLQFLSSEQGLVVKSFQKTLEGRWYIEYFDRSKWIEPQRVLLPSDTTYNIQMADYIRRCTVFSRTYATFEDMVMGEIRRLKEKL